MSTRRVHLIGVDHIVQHDGFALGGHDDPVVSSHKIADAIHKFKEYLRVLIRETGAAVLAEEFSKQAIIKSQATGSSAEQVAQELGIGHLFCDPGTSEREELSIGTDAQREDYWAARLVPLAAEEIIFVCGDAHVATFPEVLERHGFQCCVASRGWGCNLYEVTSLSELIGKT